VRPPLLFGIGAGAGLAGLVLLVLEVTRALTDNALGTVSLVLLWAGVGLVAVGALLLLLTLARATSDSGQPADG
jgi:hypothetical protein